MKVLWFEVTVPSRYTTNNSPVEGWQDSLEDIVKKRGKGIELIIAFLGQSGFREKTVEGVRYIPIIPKYNRWNKIYSNFSNRWNTVNKIIPLALECINRVKPDLIQIFGTESEFAQVAKYCKIPIVVHMQGSVNPYLDAEYPPRYSFLDKILYDGLNLKIQWYNFRGRHFNKSWRELERSNYKNVVYYMGRTAWDRKIIDIFHPNANYFHVWEALRPIFLNTTEKWKVKDKRSVHRLITVGCSSHWKGMDTLLRTAHVLKELNFNFEWVVVGNMNSVKHYIEKKEHLCFEENNVYINGFTDAAALLELLLSSNIYVHTAYIDNSPNSICEAQVLGLPIVATNVGGIPTLVGEGKGAILVPSNSCYEMASAILELCQDEDKQKSFSKWNMTQALDRHNPEHILYDLLTCYNTIIKQ